MPKQHISIIEKPLLTEFRKCCSQEIVLTCNMMENDSIWWHQRKMHSEAPQDGLQDKPHRVNHRTPPRSHHLLFREWKDGKPNQAPSSQLLVIRELVRSYISFSSRISGRKSWLHHHGLKGQITITKIKYAYVKTKTAQVRSPLKTRFTTIVFTQNLGCYFPCNNI